MLNRKGAPVNRCSYKHFCILLIFVLGACSSPTSQRNRSTSASRLRLTLIPTGRAGRQSPDRVRVSVSNRGVRFEMERRFGAVRGDVTALKSSASGRPRRPNKFERMARVRIQGPGASITASTVADAADAS